MTAVSVICHSGSGHTAKLAEAVAQGARSVGEVAVNLLAIHGEEITKRRFKSFKSDAVRAQLELTGELLGRRVAGAALRWQAGPP